MQDFRKEVFCASELGCERTHLFGESSTILRSLHPQKITRLALLRAKAHFVRHHHRNFHPASFTPARPLRPVPR
ncbi:hypothetical protein KCP70_19625 [Salmonella enterica subsp. enterica]|nr:hypothetical protein KCP70_19625 [Salmonella enterica subsp. enterica]